MKRRRFVVSFEDTFFREKAAYYKVPIEVWCDFDPVDSDLEEIAENIGTGEAICTKRECRSGSSAGHRR